MAGRQAPVGHVAAAVRRHVFHLGHLHVGFERGRAGLHQVHQPQAESLAEEQDVVALGAGRQLDRKSVV